jgi:dTDP-4-amino-4,6-dideoxygalactose transaminase
MEFRDLRAQYHALQPDIDAAISGVLESSRFIGGSEVSALEEELADFVGAKHCISCANGTDALQLALMAWGVGAGDAVFVPDFTFFSSGEVASAVGATPVFVDVDASTFNMDPISLEHAVVAVEQAAELSPRVVVAVDLFGQPADYRRIRAICDEHGLLLLEDAAQGFGGSIEGRLDCTFGDISTTSFFPAKPLGCYGDGGAVFTDDDGWANLVRSYAVHGKGKMKYDNVRVGMNSRLDAVQAAVLRVKLRAFADHELDDVNERASWYDEELHAAGVDQRGVALPVVIDGFRSSWAQYTLRLPKGCDRDALQAILKGQGIPTMVYYPKPMHEQKAFDGACVVPADGCPASEELCASVLSMPMGPYLARENVLSISEAIAASKLLPA